MAEKKAKKAPVKPGCASGARDRRPDWVERPEGAAGSVAGYVRVERVVDPIAAMLARHQISAGQAAAADRWRKAFGIVQAGGGVRLGEVGTGMRSSARPAEAVLRAAEKLNQADRVLGDLGAAIILMVVGEGHGCAQVADALFGHGKKASRADAEFVGRLLREGLATLAHLWGFETARPRRGWHWMADGARPVIDGLPPENAEIPGAGH